MTCNYLFCMCCSDTPRILHSFKSNDNIILSDVYCEISQVIQARIARVQCSAWMTSDISQYALDNVLINHMPVRMRMTLVTIVTSQ